MPRYQYHARNGHGEAVTGYLEADSAELAGKKLREQGQYVVKLIPAATANRTASVALVGAKIFASRVKREEVIGFTHQLAVMVSTGVPLKEALDCAVDQTESDAFRSVLEQVNESVQGGSTLSSSLAKFPRVFPSVMISLVNASELSGAMGDTLERVSVYLTKEHQTKKKIKRALTYPVFMLTTAVLVTVFLLISILPRFAAIYEGRGAALPAPTRFLLSLSDNVIGYWYAWVAVLIVLAVGVVCFAQTQIGRRTVDYLKLKSPVLGALFKKLYLSRACSTMGAMTLAGVAVLDMIAAVRQVTDNSYYRELWDVVDDRLRKGGQLSEPLFHSSLIPRPIAQMVFSGEKAGRLGQVLNRVADYTESDLDDAVKNATQFIEPVMIMGMGLLIGFIALALLLPVFSVSRVIASG